jgi:hypothetical protein
LDNLFAGKRNGCDAGFGSVEIANCIAAAKTFLTVAPKQFQGNSVIAAIWQGSIDASKREPFFGVDVVARAKLVNSLRGHYGFK